MKGGVLAFCVVWSVAEAAAQETTPQASWYGMTKLDASWDEASVSAGNFARWVTSPEAAAPHAHFNMTARQTRIGLRLRSDVDGAVIQGRWEVDFYGGGAENKNALQVRHAFVEASWASGWTLLAGQTSDVISPLVPGTLNYVVAWWSGNVGYRRPQLRVSKESVLGPTILTVTGAATRTIGDDFGGESGDTGAGSGEPTVQGRIGLSWPLGGRRVALGLYAHRGVETLEPEVFGEVRQLSSTGWGGDLILPLGPLVISGEAWAGSNLDDYFGGIGQGVALGPSSASAVRSHGGWLQLAWSRGPTSLGVGYGIDDPDEGDLAVGGRSRNRSLWATAQREIGGGLTHGIEVSRWTTDYVGLDAGASLRVQLSVMYGF